ncbi:hypothetical protein HD806DRAFT_529232 [Xylariaceae sp. AK1471]|nr:hypothetical protein HD806DRAFT_529232 [Xylariaceae sp. AK1471]
MQLTIAAIAIITAALAAASPVSSIAPRKYMPGHCGVHVTQWRKNLSWNEVGDDYQYDVSIKDGFNRWLNATIRLAIPDLETANVYSDLPAPLKIYGGVIDSDPVVFEYIGFKFSSSQKQYCSTGRYTQDTRDMDCGFSCD